MSHNSPAPAGREPSKTRAIRPGQPGGHETKRHLLSNVTNLKITLITDIVCANDLVYTNYSGRDEAELCKNVTKTRFTTS